MREDAAEDRRRFLAGVYRESGAQLYRYALMILAHRGDAEDVLQQVFAAALGKAPRREIADPAAYFRRAVRNAAYSLLQQPPRRVGFASGCQAFGHHELLGQLRSFGLVSKPVLTVHD